jgi:hypothetical protein
MVKTGTLPRALNLAILFFTESKMVEEIKAEFHRVIIGLRRDYNAVVK